MHLGDAVNIEDLRLLAKRRLPRAIFDFFDGGAEDEVTLRENRAAFERVRLLPKVLVDVSQVDTAGRDLRQAIEPAARHRAHRRHQRRPLRRGADPRARREGLRRALHHGDALGVQPSSASPRKSAGGCGSSSTPCATGSFETSWSQRAKNAGYEAILVTVDLPVSGKRERDPRNGFHTPYSPNWRNSRDVIFKPAWALDMLRNGLPGMANLEGYPFSTPAGTDIVTAVGREMDAGLDWEYIKRLRDQWPGKLLLKGVERPDDAERAAAIGCDGVVVSNHGGRQLDGAAATLDALPAISRAVGNKLTVLLDGGVRRGVDILKARALGAQAVLTGRATLFGAMAGGEPGARRALEILSTELVRAMQLCGVRSAAEIGPRPARSS